MHLFPYTMLCRFDPDQMHLPLPLLPLLLPPLLLIKLLSQPGKLLTLTAAGSLGSGEQSRLPVVRTAAYAGASAFALCASHLCF